MDSYDWHGSLEPIIGLRNALEDMRHELMVSGMKKEDVILRK